MKYSIFLSVLTVVSLITQAVASQASQTEIISIQPENAPLPAGPLSHAILVKNPQEILYISGQLPVDPVTNQLEHDIVKATKLCMERLLTILQAANMDFSNVVKTTILLKDINDIAKVNAVYESFLVQPYPARMTHQTAAIPKGACIEIEMVAVNK